VGGKHGRGHLILHSIARFEKQCDLIGIDQCSMWAIYVGDLCGQSKVAIHARSGYTFEIMMEVLLVNLAWVLLMAVWGVAYFIQARADRAKGGRYIANLEPESKD